MKEKIILVIKSIAVLLIVALICILFTYKCGKDNAVETYIVRFNSNGGSPITEQKIESKNKVSIPETPIREGYNFIGWYVEDKLYDFDSEVTENLEIVAKWEEIVIVNVTGVIVDQKSVTLAPGGTTQLIAIIEPVDASDQSVVWSSANEEIATVDENGNITALKSGKTVVTVTTTDGEFTADVNVTVSSSVVSVTGIALNKNTLELSVNSSATLKATIKPNNASNKGISWSSSNSKVAVVDTNGKITGKSAGTAVITATTKDGKYEATCKVTVNTVKVSGVSITTKPLTMYVGENKTVKASVSPSNATNKDVTWSTSDQNIAKVTQKGIVTGVNAGTATITVTTKDGNYSKSISVTVKEKKAVTEIKITGSSSGTEGGTIKLQATISPTDAYDKSISWKSSDSKIATVDKNGKVTLKQAGSVTITATASNGVNATHEIIVKEKAANYVIKFTPIVQEGTGAISQYSYLITKNGSSFSNYSFIVYNGAKVNKGSFLSSTKYNTGITTATLRLSNGEDVTATVKY